MVSRIFTDTGWNRQFRQAATAQTPAKPKWEKWEKTGACACLIPIKSWRNPFVLADSGFSMPNAARIGRMGKMGGEEKWKMES